MTRHDRFQACRDVNHLVEMCGGKVVAQGAPADVVTPALVRHLYGIDCTLVTDPLTGTPVIAAIHRTPSTVADTNGNGSGH